MSAWVQPLIFVHSTITLALCPYMRDGYINYVNIVSVLGEARDCCVLYGCTL